MGLKRIGRRAFIAVLGSILLAIGILFIFIPGPAIIVIPMALAILASEFIIIRTFLGKHRNRISGIFCKSKTMCKGFDELFRRLDNWDKTKKS